MSLKADGTYNSILLKYLTTAEEKQTITNGQFVDLTDRVLSYTIEDDVLITNIFGKVAAPTPDHCVTYDYSSGSCLGGFSHEHESTYNSDIGGQCGGSTSFIVGVNYDWGCIDAWMSSGSPGSSNPGNSNTGTNGEDGQTNNGGSQNSETVASTPTPCGHDCPEVLCVTDEAISNLTASLSLTPGIVSCLESEDNCDSTNLLNNFLNDNPNKTEFAELAAQAICDGNEVDFINEIVYDIDQKCAKEVVKFVLNNTSSLSQTMLTYFNQDKNYIIKYKNAAIPLGAQGAVNPISSCEDGICTIEVLLNNYMLENSTDIFIAKVALHETIHASLVYLFETGQFVDSGLDPNATNDPDYITLIGAYIGYMVTNNPLGYSDLANDLQHQYMDTFINDMVMTLQSIAPQLGYASDSPVMETDFLTKLAWSGSLEETTDFTNNFQIDEQDLITNLGQAELHNLTQVYDTIDFSTNPPTQVEYSIQPKGNQINNTNEPCY